MPHTSHADQLVEIARDVFGQGDSFVQKITGSPTVDRPLQRIRKFRNRKLPGVIAPSGEVIAIVQMPEVVRNLAFGAPDFRTLYLTRRGSLSKLEVKTPGIGALR